MNLAYVNSHFLTFPKYLKKYPQIAILGLLLYSCQTNSVHIIPSPETVINRRGFLHFNEGFTFSSVNTDSTLDAYFLDIFGKSLVIEPEVNTILERKGVTFEILKTYNLLGEEGYILDINRKGIQLQANTDKGIFYGIQSLLQLLPSGFFSNETSKNAANVNMPAQNIKGTLKLPYVRIVDRPRYSWRGFMLDSGRQYHPPEFIKRYIDLLALFKINVFHWHLTENDGWRVEIRKYPKLTKIGAFVADGSEQQGYYTRREMEEIVDYARTRYIEIMPEIDLPGHANAALMAYPEYSCLGTPPVKTQGHSPYLFCGGNDETYNFLQDVLDEVCDIFPYAYIHLGGDEAPKDIWDVCATCQRKIKKENLSSSHELQQYFSNRLASYLIQKNRVPVFWEDVLYYGSIPLPMETVIQWWNYRSKKEYGLQLALERNLRVIASPNYYTYLSFPETPWAGYQENRTFNMETAYTRNPAHFDNTNPLVMGITACLWTDYGLTRDMINERVFPRILVLAEQMWNKKPLIEFEEFDKRVKEVMDMTRTINPPPL